MSSTSYGSGKLSREDYKKQKDLEAARKAGTAPAEVDEEGNAINPHIPEFMSKAPWYMDTGKIGLHHQRKDKKDNPDPSLQETEWYARGARVGTVATKFRKGACENCGVLSHKTKDCMERPRKKGAKWTGKDMKADEVVQDISLSYDAKRDRWNGYDPAEHQKLMADWELIEEARRKRKASELDKDVAGGSSTAGAGAKADGIEAEFASSDEENDDEDRYIGKGGDEEKLNA
ncbi:mRNA splicing protein, partial [Coemansia sp. S2]